VITQYFRCICFLLLAVTAPVIAEDKPAQPQLATHRITGLFAPDREIDLRRALEQLPEVELISLNFDHAEATFRYDPAKAFPGTKPADIEKRFNDKLRSASSHTLGVQPLDPTIPKDKLTRIEIPVAGLDCRACSLAAYEIVAKIDGVYQATASFKEGRITALIDPTKTDRAALIAALTKRNVTVPTP